MKDAISFFADRPTVIEEGHVLFCLHLQGVKGNYTEKKIFCTTTSSYAEIHDIALPFVKAVFCSKVRKLPEEIGHSPRYTISPVTGKAFVVKCSVQPIC